ncbi:MAG TPA: hypothetical protein VL326_01690, partial [Kofleriaceae bacterium]|nr:hypothetical protein [Kofleriaceae bacterium]
MRSLSSIPRRWLIAGAIALGGLFLLVTTLAVIYPRVGAYMIKKKVAARLEGKLGRKVTFGDIDVSLGHAVLSDINIRGPADGQSPLVHVDRVDVDFDTWASFVGNVKVGEAKIDGVMVSVRRDQ